VVAMVLPALSAEPEPKPFGAAERAVAHHSHHSRPRSSGPQGTRVKAAQASFLANANVLGSGVSVPVLSGAVVEKADEPA
jgi:hypothetical protein